MGRLIIAGYHQDGLRSVNLQTWNWNGLDVINAHEREHAIYIRASARRWSASSRAAWTRMPLHPLPLSFEELGQALESPPAREGFMKAPSPWGPNAHLDRARPERILMTADAVGGVWTYALDLASGLARSGIEVVLATMGPSPTPRSRRRERVPGLTLRVSEFKLEWMPDSWRDVERAGDWLLSLATEERPDLIQINGFCHASLPFRAPVLAVCHSDVLSWWRQ